MDSPSQDASLRLEAVRLPIAGMRGTSCAGRIEQALRAVPGVHGASVDPASGWADVQTVAPADHRTLARAIERAGYAVPIIKTELNYHSPLFYDDLMFIHTRPAKLELVKARFDYLITRADNGEIVCTGYTLHCAVNASLIPVEIDERTIALWRQFPV